MTFPNCEAPDEVEPYRRPYDPAEDWRPCPKRTGPLWTGRPASNLVAEIAAIQAAHVAAVAALPAGGGVGLPEADEDRDEAVWVEPTGTANIWTAADGPEWV